jgi:murein DD-endopeptidase MepM/ murein hydrolase activator NlpD
MEKLSTFFSKENICHKLGYTSRIYRLPVLSDLPTCFVNENISHIGRDRWAMDFDVPIGAVVCSPANGRIVLIEQYYVIASHNPLDGNKVNQIIIRTNANETCEIKHIQADSCGFKIGEEIREGQVLATVGLNGYYVEDRGVEFPSHLHFAVHGHRSLPLKVRFRGYEVVYGSNGSVVFTKGNFVSNWF